MRQDFPWRRYDPDNPPTEEGVYVYFDSDDPHYPCLLVLAEWQSFRDEVYAANSGEPLSYLFLGDCGEVGGLSEITD